MKTKLLLSLVFVVFAYIGHAQVTHTITISNYKFSNADLTINVGDKVIWENSQGSHDVIEGSNCTATSNGFASAMLSQGGTFEHTFSTAGTVNYFCTPHCGMGMTGKITVSASTTEIISGKSSIHDLKTYPNPFTQNSSVEFNLATAGKIKAEVFDMKGNKFIETTETHLTEGLQTIAIPAENLKDGIYVCKIYFNGQITAAEYMVKVSK